jgi:hypothetical protein
VTIVCPIGTTITIVGRSKNDNVVTTTERIFKYCGWTKVNIRVMARCLAGGGTIEVPIGELGEFGNLVGDRLSVDGSYSAKRGGYCGKYKDAYPAL